VESRKGLSEKRLEINRAVACNVITKGGRYQRYRLRTLVVLTKTTKIK
jgi:hypothetical protein